MNGGIPSPREFSIVNIHEERGGENKIFLDKDLNIINNKYDLMGIQGIKFTIVNCYWKATLS